MRRYRRGIGLTDLLILPISTSPSTRNGSHPPRGRCDRIDATMAVVETRLRVRYSETDRMGIAYHANHLVWFEVGRSDFCRAAGAPYTDMEHEGYFMVVTEAACRYVKPATYDQEIIVRTRLHEINRRAVRFEYELVSAADSLVLATGHTRHILLDRAGRPTILPAQWGEALKRLQDGA